MRDIKLRAWYLPEKRMYYRGYQKLLHVLLCRSDPEDAEGMGVPVQKVSHEDCELMETTSLLDCDGTEIFEGDVVQVDAAEKKVTVLAGTVPDMFRSRGLHPLQEALDACGIDAEEVQSLKVLGNQYEHKELLAGCDYRGNL